MKELRKKSEAGGFAFPFLEREERDEKSSQGHGGEKSNLFFFVNNYETKRGVNCPYNRSL